ncbi:MAG: D-glycero-beta-D-manno-heptose 1,7-bisphosphate 7-phosphatase [Legionellaceae bacterium]|nr:D-glycero-beta-D-manno-heptose 1,7-bisphosphate 7-phosphatase [Legionellaceae bacterium]MBP9774385.1 D-glycero-beta-D-manno-heptose 1,7-bisphosphate 7-phosphatase [Legionellaceae bacterium]
MQNKIHCSHSSSLIVLDRDGVINQDTPYFVKSNEEFIFLPGSLEAIRRLTAAGYPISIATNQSGIGRGYLNEEILSHIHQKMLNAIRQHGGNIIDIAYCPHVPEDCCVCRKPKPGLLMHLAQSSDRLIQNIIFIGDRLSDLKTAEKAGSQFILVRSSMTEPEVEKNYPHILQFDSLLDTVNYLLVK